MRALAAHHGLSDEALNHYPAYRAIIRSVLAGAGLNLPEASDAEMTRFLDLMFNPVADLMITTLFIERQRVEKALQSIATSLPTHIRTGRIHTSHPSWHTLLTKSGIPLVVDASLEEGTIELSYESSSFSLRVNLCEMPVPDSAASSGQAIAPCLILSQGSEYGRVIECATPQSNTLMTSAQPMATQGMLAALAKKLQCFLFFTNGLTCQATQSLLLALQQAKGSAIPPTAKNGASEAEALQSLDAIALAVAQALEEGRLNDPGVVDVAAVLAGIAPAYSGGPLSYGIATFMRGDLDAVDAAMTKMWLSNLHCKVVDECLQLFGGWGYMWEYPIARAYADARVVKIAGGSIEVMKRIIGRQMFADLKHKQGISD